MYMSVVPEPADDGSVVIWVYAPPAPCVRSIPNPVSLVEVSLNDIFRAVEGLVVGSVTERLVGALGGVAVVAGLVVIQRSGVYVE